MLNIFPRSTCNQAFVWLMAVWAQYFSIVFKTPSLAKSAFREPYVELWVSLVVGLLLRFSEINNDRWWKKGTPSYRLSARSSICIPRWMSWFTYTFFHTHTHTSPYKKVLSAEAAILTYLVALSTIFLSCFFLQTTYLERHFANFRSPFGWQIFRRRPPLFLPISLHVTSIINFVNVMDTT